MSSETSHLDLKYALFDVVSDVVTERRESSTKDPGQEPPPADVTDHVRAHARSLDDGGLTALHVELGRGFLLDIDRWLSRRSVSGPG